MKSNLQEMNKDIEIEGRKNNDCVESKSPKRLNFDRLKELSQPKKSKK